MKKFKYLDRAPSAQSVRQGSCCTSGSPCLRCSMIRLTSHRFVMFSKKFGRMPEQNDELFFDEAQSHPVRATRSEIRKQILAASRACGLNCLSLLSFLGLGGSSSYDEHAI